MPTLRLQLIVDGKRRKFKTTRPSIFLGNAKLCDVQVKLNSIQENYIEVKIIDDEIYIINNYTPDGLYLDHQRILPKAEVLYKNQAIRIGSASVNIKMALEHNSESVPSDTITKIKTRVTAQKDISKVVEFKAKPKPQPKEKEPTTTQGIYQINPRTQHRADPIEQSLNEVDQSVSHLAIKAANESFEPSVTQQYIKSLLASETKEHGLKVEGRNKELDELQTECLKLKKDIRLYEYNCVELKSKEDHLKEEVTELKEVISGFEEKRESLEQEFSILSSQREIANVDVGSLQAEKSNLEEELATTSTELKKQKDELSVFTKDMMTEYTDKKEEAISFYDNKVKEATKYFDNKERSFKEEKKDMQTEINSRLKECDLQIRREKDLWQAEFKRHQGEMELIKEKILGESLAKKDKIIREAEDQAIKSVEEFTELAEQERLKIVNKAEEERDQVIQAADDLKESADKVYLQIIKKAKGEREQILEVFQKEGDDLLQKLTGEAKKTKNEILEEAEFEKEEIIKEAKKTKQDLLYKAREKAIEDKEAILTEGMEEKKEILLEANRQSEKVIDQAHEKILKDTSETRKAAEEEIKKDKEEEKKLIADSERARLEAENSLREQQREFEQGMVHQKLEQEKIFSRTQEKNSNKEKERIKSNIQNVSENMVTLFERKFSNATMEAKDIWSYLPMEEVKAIVSDSFDVDAPMHDKNLGQFLLKNSNARDTLQKFYKKMGVWGAILIVVIITFIINPNIIGDTKSLLVKAVSRNQSSNDAMVESMKQTRLNRLRFNPIRDERVRASFMESIIYTARYRELIMTRDYKKKWTIELNVFILKGMELSEEVVIKYMAIETKMHSELLEVFNNTYDEHKERGINRLKVIEEEILPEMKKLFKTDKNWKSFLKFRESFFEKFRDQ